MKLSKKAEYALRAVVAMARSSRTKPVPIQELSEVAHVPVKFLEQILLILKRGGILQSKRGVGGGYQLLKQASHITLAEVVRLIDGEFVPMSCTEAVAADGSPGGTCECGQQGGCGLGRSFSDLQHVVNEYLESQSIQDILQREQPDDVLVFEI